MEANIVGSRISVARARVVWNEMKKIRAERGSATPAHIVESARDKRSPLHDEFEWDDRKAGHAHRLNQAAALVRSVDVIIQSDPDDKPRRIRALVSVTTKGIGQEYIPSVEALSIKEYREQMLVDALRELDAFKRKYRELSDLAVVFEAIERAQQRKAKMARKKTEVRRSRRESD